MRLVPALMFVFLLGAGISAQRNDFYDIDTMQTVSFVFKQANWKTLLQNNHASKTYIRCDVMINGTLFKDAGVRYRGNSSYSKLPPGSDKQPYKVKLDAFVPGQNYQGYATLNISNTFMDPTWIRETVGYYVFRQFMPAPKSNYLTLKVNNVDYGPFVNTQQMNKAFLRQWFPSDDGNRYKPLENFKQQANLAYLGPTATPYSQTYAIKNPNPTAPWTDLIAATNALNNSGPNLEATLPRFMDVDNALRLNAGAITLLWLDSYVGPVCHNYLLYHEQSHGRFQFMPWDMNNSFGGFVIGKGLAGMTSLSLYYASTPTKSPRPLQSNLLQVPAWRSRYVAQCREISKWLDWTRIKPVIDRFQKVVAPAAANDPKRLYPHSHFTSNLTSTSVLTQYNLTIYGIKPVVDGRKAYLSSLPEFTDPVNTITQLQLTPARPLATTPLQFTVRVVPPSNLSVDKVKLHWRVQGPYQAAQMFDDGQHGDGKANDGVFGVRLPAQAAGSLVEYYVESTVQNNKAWNMNFFPPHASFRPRSVRIEHPRGGPGLRVSELMARNSTTIQDEANEYEDWVEISNPTSASVDVSGMYLTDDPKNPAKWKFPTNQRIPAGGALLVWCDNESNDGPLHASFKLDGDGEWVGLFDRDGATLIDDVRFGPQRVDVSIGRMYGYPSIWASFPSATPRTVNRATPCGHLPYGPWRNGPSPVTLAGTGSPKVGLTASYTISAAPASTPGYFALALAPLYVDLGRVGALLVNPAQFALLPMTTNGNGAAPQNLPVPNLPVLAGQTVYLQAFVHNGQAGGFSNGVSTTICP